MCHQAIEKSLKAIIARDCEEGQIPPKIHDLSKLAIRANLLDKMTEAQRDFIDDLNPLNIEARYPEYKDTVSAVLTEEQSKALVAGTEEMACWIKAQF
jgi:HEPN domain-containing protein